VAKSSHLAHPAAPSSSLSYLWAPPRRRLFCLPSLSSHATARKLGRARRAARAPSRPARQQQSRQAATPRHAPTGAEADALPLRARTADRLARDTDAPGAADAALFR
jgi:hypothetical protein